MKKEYYKTEEYGNLLVKYWAIPNLDFEDCLFGFDIEIDGKPACQWDNCAKNCCCALFESDTDAMHQVDDCRNCCLCDISEENPEDNIEEYPEDFEIKPVNKEN